MEHVNVTSVVETIRYEMFLLHHFLLDYANKLLIVTFSDEIRKIRRFTNKPDVSNNMLCPSTSINSSYVTSDILLQNMHYVYCYISGQILYIIRCHALFVLKPLNLVHSKI